MGTIFFYTPPLGPKERAFNAAYARVLLVTMANNHTQLAVALQSSTALVSDAHRRRKIPSEWLQILSSVYHVSPQWILYGTEPRDSMPDAQCEDATQASRVQAVK